MKCCNKDILKTIIAGTLQRIMGRLPGEIKKKLLFFS